MVHRVPVHHAVHPARLEDERDEGDPDPEDTPETPLDEPEPPRVEDPPPQPEQQGPYVVSAW
jgi:hypothetical protein